MAMPFVNWKLPLSRFITRVFSLKLHRPGGALVCRLLPRLGNLIRSHTHHSDSIESHRSIWTSTRSVKLGQTWRHFPLEYMDATLVVREHSVPATIIRAIGKHIFALVTSAAVPA